MTELDSQSEAQHNGKNMQRWEKVTIYLTPEQADKLNDLAYQHGKKKRKHVNRNDIVRMLIEHCTVEKLSEIDR